MKQKDTTVEDSVVFHLCQYWLCRLRQLKLPCSHSLLWTTRLCCSLTIVA